MPSLPLLPGVYWFLDQSGKVLYVGKAKNLKKRLSQYALKQDDRPQIGNLLSQTVEVKTQILESELLALLVEAELIKRYQPQFNILLKDDKSNLYICIDHQDFPKIFTARKQEVMRFSDKHITFGPFPSAFRVRQVLSVARTIFKWCDKPQGHRPCFYYHINLCDGACVGRVTASEYQEKLKLVREFLRGKTSELIKEWKQEIVRLSEAQQFEKAAMVRDSLQALLSVTSPQYRLSPDLVLPVLTANMQQEALVSLRAILRQYINLPATSPLSRIEGYDISNIQGTNASCSMVVAIDGKMTNSEYKHFGIKTLHTPNDYGMLKEALTRRQNHPEWGIPDVILIDGGKGQLRSVLSVWKWPSIVISIAKKPDRLMIPIVTAGKKKSEKSTLTYKEILLTSEIPATRLIQSIRDESHRFAKRLHTIKRNNSLIQ